MQFSQTSRRSKQLDSTPKIDELNKFAAQIAAMKAIFVNEIHGLKLGLEKFKSYFEENGETLSDDKLSDRYLIMELKFQIFLQEQQNSEKARD